MDCINEVANVAYYEARSSEQNMRAVIHVILNRAKEKKVSTCVVIRQPNQFATRGPIRERSRWQLAKKIALNPGRDITGGATFFHNLSVKPRWTYKLRVTYRIDGHIFYAK
jgi:spore germination cell wall hydrolase CwlJ-like protein